MTAQTATIADFLLARYDEDEAAALTAVGYESRAYWEGAVAQRSLRPESVAHYERHDPDRVLAECEANRRIVELHALVPRPGRDEDPWICAQCGEAPGEEFGWCPWPCDTLRALAMPYVDHPDFLEEWRA